MNEDFQEDEKGDIGKMGVAKLKSRPTSLMTEEGMLQG